MTLALLIAISIMWIPVGLNLLGHGEAKASGLAAGVVGGVVVVGATLQAALFKDPFTAGLLYLHGLLYLVVCYTFMSGTTDLRPMANVSLTTALGSTIYGILFVTGGPMVGDARLVVATPYLALACAGYAVLTYEVFLVGYGKLQARWLAYSLFLWVVVGLWIPAFWLLVANKLPF